MLDLNGVKRVIDDQDWLTEVFEEVEEDFRSWPKWMQEAAMEDTGETI